MDRKNSLVIIAVCAILAVLKLYYSGNVASAEEKTMQNSGDSYAIFSGGCFWCMQPAFDKLPGVHATVVGYTGGSVANPTYEQVTSGKTGHRESIKVVYDPTKVSYEKLLQAFWHTIDPTQTDGQFADRGSHYLTAIFVKDDEQRRLAEASKMELAKSGKFQKPIATEILSAGEFYPAEDYHQAYYKKNALHYNSYKVGSGRAGYLERTWGKSD